MKNIFPHANTIVCIEDSKLLKQIDYDILHNAAGLDAALLELNELNYFRTHQNAQADNYGALLDGLTRSTFALMREISPSNLIWRMFQLYYDIHNMKLVVKERFFNKKLDALSMDMGGYSLPTIRSAVVRKSDNILGNAVLTEGFFHALSLKSSYDIDFVLDKLYFKTLRDMATKLKSPEIEGFIIEKIDLFNISLVFQTVSAGIPEGYFGRAFSEDGSYLLEHWLGFLRTDKPDEIEKFQLWRKYKPIWAAARDRNQALAEVDVWIDNYMIEKTKACKLMAFGLEPICAYFFNKFMEIKNIRILLGGKAANHGSEEIRKRMRIPYEYR